MNSMLFVDKSGCSSIGKLVPAKLLPLMAKYTLPFNKSVKSVSLQLKSLTSLEWSH